MEWWETIIIFFGGATMLMATGLPVVFCFLVTTAIGVMFVQGGGKAFFQWILSLYSSVHTFTLLPVPLFILMGEILWHSKIANRAIDVIDKMLGRLPGRLSILTILSGTVFSALSGSTMANTAMLGTILLPDMEKRGYKRQMSIGPIVASGGLAMMIPPSTLGVVLASLANLSVAKILIGCLVPGLIISALFMAYILIRCTLQPELTPPYQRSDTPASEKIVAFIKYILPLGLLIFVVTGLILLGVATPTESAALGCLGAIILGAAYRSLSWESIKKAVLGSVNISAMVLAILVSAIGFSQILAYSGASTGLIEFVTSLPTSSLVILLCIQLAILFLGCFMEQIAIMLITLPTLMPIIKALHFDPIWFGVIMLINLEMALTTPPFGTILFVMKGVSPKDVTMREIYSASFPFLICNGIGMAIIIAFPQTVYWIQNIVEYLAD